MHVTVSMLYSDVYLTFEYQNATSFKMFSIVYIECSNEWWHASVTYYLISVSASKRGSYRSK